MKNIPEIIAPGGSYSKAIVAATYGAEAIYLGVPFTSLRMRQNKLRTFDNLKEIIDKLHDLGKKVYLTMNIFPRNQDIEIFETVVSKISQLNADAIIFSDPGTYNIIRKHMPTMPLHLSTQTSTMNYQAAKFWYDLGVKRIVLARELHIDEIKQIKEKIPGLELEIFVHGSMCMAYSGRCVMGDYMSGRPGNKGECAHDCRFKYKVWLEEERRPGQMFQLENDGDGSHILSSKDLCTIDRLREILPYVDALKIEGRSKSEFYVGSVVKAYKEARDAILNNTQPSKEITNLVNIIPHREYWDGFLFNKLADFPDGENNNIELAQNKSEIRSTTLTSAGPLFNRNFFGVFTDQYVDYNGQRYYQIDPKEIIAPGMKLKYISPNNMGELTIKNIINNQNSTLEKATCNSGFVYVLTDKFLNGWEILYTEVSDLS